MSYPKNPNIVVIRNAYYPSGLTEKNIYEYYQKNKNKILDYIGRNPVLLFIVPNVNEVIIRRFLNHKLIRLTSTNFDQIITGRTISISVESGSTVDKYIVDIDSSANTSEGAKQKAVEDVLEVYKKLPEIKEFKVFLSGNGYHVYGVLVKKINYLKAIKVLKTHLNYSLSKYYSIGTKRRGKSTKVINLDLSPMYNRGSHTVPFSLNRNGLICDEVTNRYKGFNRGSATI